MNSGSSPFALLATEHRELADILEQHGPPATFDRPPTFETLVLLILEQQVSLDSARAAFDRLASLVPRVLPDHVVRLTDEQLREAGFSRQKTRYTREIAERILDGRLGLDGLADRSDDEVRSLLMEIPGIGRWTADVFLMASLGRGDIWPVGDRALQVAVKEALELPTVPDEGELERIGVRWRPHRTAAANILWHGYLRRRNRSIPGTALG